MQLLQSRLNARPIQIFKRPGNASYIANKSAYVGEGHRQPFLLLLFDNPASRFELTDGSSGRPLAIVDRQAEQPPNRGRLIATYLLSQESSASLDNPANLKRIESFMSIQNDVESPSSKG